MNNRLDWKPYNKIGKRIQISNRENRIVVVQRVDPPENHDEVERLYVEYEDTHEFELIVVRGVRIGEDWIR